MRPTPKNPIYIQIINNIQKELHKLPHPEIEGVELLTGFLVATMHRSGATKTECYDWLRLAVDKVYEDG